MSPQRVINLTFLICTGLAAAFIAATCLLSPTQMSIAAPIQPAAITRLTHDPASALRPAWSPDNRWIAFESSRDGASHIYVMNTDGTNQHALTSGAMNDRHPNWTPDGKSILYDSSDSVHQDIWIVNVADSTRKQLTHVDGLAECAAMSPDGTRIAFYVYKDMTLNIWLARADGSDAKPLTHDLADARRNQPTTAWQSPAWSPDSQWLTYTGGDGKSIWLMRADGSDAREIVNDGETNHLPWFMSNDQIAYITEYVPPKYDGAWTNAWVYDLKTGERTLKQEYMSMQGPVDWNADYSKIIFSSPRAGKFDIYLIDLNAAGGMDALRGSLGIVDVKDELEAAADLLEHFETHWKKAEGNPAEQQRLIHLIFERIWIKNNEIASVCLRPNYHVTFYQSGSDGRRLLSGNFFLVILVATPPIA